MSKKINLRKAVKQLYYHRQRVLNMMQKIEENEAKIKAIMGNRKSLDISGFTIFNGDAIEIIKRPSIDERQISIFSVIGDKEKNILQKELPGS